MRSDAIVNVLVWRKVGLVTKCNGQFFECGQKFLTGWIFRDRPQIIFDTVVWIGQFPTHFDLDWMTLSEFVFDFVGIDFEHEERRDANVGPRPIVGHDRFGCFALSGPHGRHTSLVGTQTRIVGNNDAGRPGTLSVADLDDTTEEEQEEERKKVCEFV